MKKHEYLKLSTFFFRGDTMEHTGKMRPILLACILLFSTVGCGTTLSSQMSGRGGSLNSLFNKVNPAVVMIQIFDQGGSSDQDEDAVSFSGLGSGVVISKDGLVLTAAHVVQTAHIVQVTFQGGAQVPAKIIGTSVVADVALLKLEEIPGNMVVASMGNSDSVRVGDPVFVVGSPYGIDNTLTVGYVSGRRKPQNIIDRFLPVEMIQTDAAINQGNSGGPMFNMNGKVIGIVSNILSQSGGFEGIGFAVSINTARSLLLDSKSIWTGLETYLVDDKLAEILNVPQDAGILVLKVAEQSPGYYLGLQAGNIPLQLGGNEIPIGGDIILEIQGIKITRDLQGYDAIRDILFEHPDLKGIKVKVLRGGQVLELQRKNE